MHMKNWMWFLAGWLLALVISPTMITGMFKAKKA